VTVLLDSNVLIALVVAEHVHHDHAAKWFANVETAFATCPVTQGALVRFLLRNGNTVPSAQAVLSGISASVRHEFWSDDVSFVDVELTGVIGHRQVTDAYLAQLARNRDGQLATLDAGLAHLHNDVALLLEPTGS
jgi:uncharacterized protein